MLQEAIELKTFPLAKPAMVALIKWGLELQSCATTWAAKRDQVTPSSPGTGGTGQLQKKDNSSNKTDAEIQVENKYLIGFLQDQFRPRTANELQLGVSLARLP